MGMVNRQWLNRLACWFQKPVVVVLNRQPDGHFLFCLVYFIGFSVKAKEKKEVHCTVFTMMAFFRKVRSFTNQSIHNLRCLMYVCMFAYYSMNKVQGKTVSSRCWEVAEQVMSLESIYRQGNLMICQLPDKDKSAS